MIYICTGCNEKIEIDKNESIMCPYCTYPIIEESKYAQVKDIVCNNNYTEEDLEDILNKEEELRKKIKGSALEKVKEYIEAMYKLLKDPKAKWQNKAISIKAEDLKLVNKSFVTADYEDRECDIVYEVKINETKVIFYVLLEFQSTVDYTMPLRLLIYITEILRDHAKNAEHKKYDKDLKIPAVVPIVLYNGESKWDVEQEFRKIIENEELFGEGLINFKYDLFDVNNSYTKEELIDSKNVTSAIFLLDQKIDEIEFLERIKVIALYFNNLTDTELIALKHWIKNTVQNQLADSAIEILESKKEDVERMVANNAFILTEMKEKAMQEGIEKRDIEIVLNMLSEGLNEETISKLTKIDINKVLDIKNKYKN